MTIEVRPARDGAERDAALDLRRRVFCAEQGVSEREEVDGHDDVAVHLVAIGEGEVIGTCRLLYRGSTCQLSRMAVEPRMRRSGVGARLLASAEDHARASGARRIALHAQLHAEPLYAAHGYRPRGRRFMEAAIEHIAMENVLA